MKITEENFQSIEIIESFHETKNNVQHIGSPAHQARDCLVMCLAILPPDRILP